MSRIFKSISVGEKPVVIDVPAKIIPATEKFPEPGTELESKSPEDSDIEYAAKGEQLLEKARQEAKEILAVSHQQAQSLKEETAEFCESLKNQAHEQGMQQGYNDGLAQAKQYIDEALLQAEEIVANARRQGKNALFAAEQQMVDIAMAVARKILNREIAENQFAILPMVRASLERVREQDQINIRVSPANLEVVTMAKAEFQSIIPGDSVLTIVADEGLRDGDCVIETPFGAVDARVDNQFETIKSALRDVDHDLV